MNIVLSACTHAGLSELWLQHQCAYVSPVAQTYWHRGTQTAPVLFHLHTLTRDVVIDQGRQSIAGLPPPMERLNTKSGNRGSCIASCLKVSCKQELHLQSICLISSLTCIHKSHLRYPNHSSRFENLVTSAMLLSPWKWATLAIGAFQVVHLFKQDKKGLH